MSALVLIFSVLLTELGPNDFLIRQQLRHAASRLRPVEHLAERLPSLWVVEHAQASWSRVFATDRVPWPFPTGVESSRLLPGLALPRLFLRADLTKAGRPLPLEAFALDDAEWYLQALFRRLAWPTHEVESRAAATLPDVPVERRHEAWIGMATDFLAHVLSTTHELARSETRSGRRCVAGSPLALVYERAFALGRFPATWVERDPQGAEQARTSRSSLGREDKLWVAAHCLSRSWQGDAVKDLGCRAAQP